MDANEKLQLVRIKVEELQGMGDTTSQTPSATVILAPMAPMIGLIGMASVGLSAYHGYKRNQSVPWAVGWGLMGAIFPVITPAIAFAQGFGDPLKKSNPGDSSRACVRCDAILDEDLDYNDDSDEWEVECRACRLGGEEG